MMSENKYHKGQIYKITDVAYTECYYGSTIEPLNKRMVHHRHRYINRDSGKETCIRSVNVLFDKYGLENCKIEWVEDYPCNSKKELARREGFYIQNNRCVNKNVAGRTNEECRQVSKEKKNKHQSEYYQKNAERIKEYQKEHSVKYADEIKERKKKHYEANKDKFKEFYLCSCGRHVQNRSKTRHEKTQYHQNRLKQQEPEEETELVQQLV